ncbi:MAG: hypothetical protein KKF50_01615 [Nanoarchaeota archaeon]|nr:hypothetical protein [Nanoarchaeota archaeon]
MKSNLIVVLIVLVFSLNFISAAENLTNEELAIVCVENSQKILDDLSAANFSVQRINDTLKEAVSLFEAQIILKERRKAYDYSLVLPYCAQIEKNYENAFEARDAFEALFSFYNESISDEMNSSSIDAIISEIANELETERYEKVEPLIEMGYNEISDVRTSYTSLNLFYRSTTRGLKDFFIDNWKTFAIAIGVIIILFFIYHNTVRRWNIKRKISGLEIKKGVLKKLIQDMQKGYFEEGNISERDYTIRTKKFSELIRDIDRQIPLLKEEFVKIDNKHNRGGGVNNNVVAARASLMAVTGSGGNKKKEVPSAPVVKKKVVKGKKGVKKR